MSYMLELLQMDNDFWPPRSTPCHTHEQVLELGSRVGGGESRLHSHRTMCGLEVVNQTTTGNPGDFDPGCESPIPPPGSPPLILQSQEHSCAKVLAEAAHRGANRPMHSYYECCINVHVSSLLEHWLDWDRPSALISVPSRNNGNAANDNDRCPHLESEDLYPNNDVSSLPSDRDDLLLPLGMNNNQTSSSTSAYSWIRQISNTGCDVNRQDSEGRTLLHNLLEGASTTNFQGETIVELSRLLVETGAHANVRDHKGDTALHLVRRWLSKSDTERIRWVLELGQTLLQSAAKEAESGEALSDLVNLPDSEGRTLLSHCVSQGDRAQDLSRLLLNFGAQVLPDPPSGASKDLHPIQQLTKERTQSAFTWLLKSVMEEKSLEPFEQTIHLVAQSMAHQPVRMKRHMKRVMMHLGRGISVNGPLFSELKALMMPYWNQPRPLRQQCLSQIRRSIGPKRLNRGAVSQLGLPGKLQRMVQYQVDPQ
eukprot:snap_masked-scaffold272_size230267-processed-gene-1.4 protein:Tk00258 transcript:snap_masked-scaffold272_size230267-processed-gene-1.4-mRNA-1 annotation:"hypothetical protein L798_11774"